MFSRSRLLAVLTLGAAIGFATSEPILGAPPTCDSECRMRFDFYECGVESNYCITITHDTCAYCTAPINGWCKNNGDYDPTRPDCADPIGGQLPVPAYTHEGCTKVCECSTYRFVEATGTGDTKMFIHNVKVCRQGP